MLTLILAHVSFCVPFVVFNVRARLSGYDSSIEEASMDLGANRIRTFFEVTLPVLWPGITGGALLSFTLSIDDVIISYFVNGQTKTYPLRVMESIKSGVAPDVNALSALTVCDLEEEVLVDFLVFEDTHVGGMVFVLLGHDVPDTGFDVGGIPCGLRWQQFGRDNSGRGRETCKRKYAEQPGGLG